MFSFNTVAKLRHVTPLPPGVTFETALAHLQNHDQVIHFDPELAHYESLPTDPAIPDAKRYRITDHMHTLPKGLWDTTVTFDAEITDTEDGILWVIKAPLGLVQRTVWRLLRTETLAEDEEVQAKAEAERGEWTLVEAVEIHANRLLVGTVRGKCEESWRGIHAKYVGHVTGKSAVATTAATAATAAVAAA